MDKSGELNLFKRWRGSKIVINVMAKVKIEGIVLCTLKMIINLFSQLIGKITKKITNYH